MTGGTGTSATTPRVAVVLKGYPRLSETFIAQELLSLQRHGVPFAIHALRRPHDDATHPVHAAITAPVHYLPEYLHEAPGEVWRAWRACRRLPGYRAARAAFLRDFKRDPTRNRARRFGQAMVLAANLPASTAFLYAHFLHTPASVTRYAALMRGLPWACSAHAKDIYTIPAWEAREKLDEMAWLVTCTRANVKHLRDIAPDAAERITLLYHGIDLDRFAQPNEGPDEAAAPRAGGPQARGHGHAAQPDAGAGHAGARRDGSEAGAPVRLLSVGRAVEKKGYDVLLNALASLPADRAWHLTHIGGGALRAALQSQAERLGLASRITWLGARPQADVLARYREADLFVLASRIADDGDRDGLPNVLMEAQSQRLACVSTAVSAVPELIEDGVTGRLVAPGDPAELAQALDALISDPETRTRLGQAGAARVHRDFAHSAAIGPLLARFDAYRTPDVASDGGAAKELDQALQPSRTEPTQAVAQP
ncbi:MAG: glycosyltransferase family 4 protein [Pseudomonadota bacterium]